MPAASSPPRRRRAHRRRVVSQGGFDKVRGSLHSCATRRAWIRTAGGRAILTEPSAGVPDRREQGDVCGGRLNGDVIEADVVVANPTFRACGTR